jgi:ABC-2 type transport system ATP-binding protein
MNRFNRRRDGASYEPINPALLPGVASGATPKITVEHVSKWYGDVVAVSDVSFGVTPGVTGLLGPNGAGKSTLLKMISGLISTSTGSIRIEGQPARGRPDAYRRLAWCRSRRSCIPP